MLDVGTLGGTVGVPNAFNNRGQVAGQSNLAGDIYAHPFFWTKPGPIQDLGTFGGNKGIANWLNDSGEVVGTADFSGDVVHHAFVWKDGIMTDLTTVDGDPCSKGIGINSRGQVVGTSTNCHGVVQHLFLWEKGSVLNLSGLILPGSDVTFNDPTFINDRGEITGNGTLPNGYQHAVLLIPCDEDHPAIDGCDYGMVDGTAVPQSTAPWHFASGTLPRPQSRRTNRYHMPWIGAMQQD